MSQELWDEAFRLIRLVQDKLLELRSKHEAASKYLSSNTARFVKPEDEAGIKWQRVSNGWERRRVGYRQSPPYQHFWKCEHHPVATTNWLEGRKSCENFDCVAWTEEYYEIFETERRAASSECKPATS